MKRKYFFPEEKLSTLEELLYNHSYNEDVEMIERTSYSPVVALSLLGLIALLTLGILA